MKCPVCNGDGWYVDHAENCNGWSNDGYCECIGQQYQCENCKGTGEITAGGGEVCSGG